MLRVARYRFRATFRRRWGGYLVIALLIGSTGGLAIGAVAAGRRTQSAFPAFLASTNPSELLAQFSPSGNGYDAAVIDGVAHLPLVRHAESFAVLTAGVLNPDGTARTGPTRIPVAGSVDGGLFDQDRFTVTDGRMANPERADEVMASQLAADTLGLHVGQIIPIAVLRSDSASPGTGPVTGIQTRVDATIVGIGKLNSEVIQDDIGRFPTYIVATPALTRPLLDCCVGWTWTGIQLEHGSADIPAVEREYVAALPPGDGYQFHITTQVKDQVQRSIEPEAIALVVFGGIAAIAGLLIAGQAIGRHVRLHRIELEAMRAIGASPSMTVADGLLGLIGAVLIGAVLAVGFAIALSPIGPIGPVRSVYPSRGVAFDWTVLGGGVALVIVVLGGLAVGLAYRSAPHRVARRDRQRVERTSAAVRGAATAGLPAPAVAGIRFALESGHGRTAVPVRSAIAGATVAVVLVVATVTFGSGLSTLVSHPALYGWDWNYALESTDGYGPITPDAQARLDADPNIAATSGVYFGTADIDGQAVACLFGTTHAALAPPILSGRTFDNAGEIVLGEATLSQLHKQVGDTVTVSHGSDFTPFQLRVVGTATMPAVGILDGLHSSMGTGALLPADVLPDDVRNAFGPLSGPNMVFVRFRRGVDATGAMQTLEQAAKANDAAVAASPDYSSIGAESYVLPVQRPAEIVNYRSMGNTPPLLAGGLAIGALVALALTLAASVRRRRRDLALLKTLGFTHRQLASVVAWQASVAAVIGIALGVPLGIALGRWLWILFAHQIFAVPQPTVPVVSVALVAAGALVLANIVAALPGRSAARTPTALLLRAE
ncbi:MAG: putative transport system permease protein [Acidimicrobiaceae bacterium]